MHYSYRMAYNLYQVQMAQAWTERVKKENAMAERFWATRKSDDLVSEVSVRTNATSRSTDTTVLKARLEALESELSRERDYRKKVESDLKMLKGITEE